MACNRNFLQFIDKYFIQSRIFNLFRYYWLLWVAFVPQLFLLVGESQFYHILSKYQSITVKSLELCHFFCDACSVAWAFLFLLVSRHSCHKGSGRRELTTLLQVPSLYIPNIKLIHQMSNIQCILIDFLGEFEAGRKATRCCLNNHCAFFCNEPACL